MCTKRLPPQIPPSQQGNEPNPHSPTLQSQFFSQSYESILPNSFTHILLCTRGFLPWKPEAVLSTPARRENLRGWTLRFSRGMMGRPNDFKSEAALPSTRPVLSVKEFPGCELNSLKRKEDSSRFPSCRVAVSLRYRAISDNLTPFWNINQIPFR